MNFSIRDGKFDVVIAAGPRIENWPSIGVRTLSILCAEMGLSVGQFGGESMLVRGIIPLPGTGGLVLIEDIQKRIHRIHARAIVRVSADSSLPDPFLGWRSQGVLPLSVAKRLFRESRIRWEPCTVILGTGNAALHFGTQLLEKGLPEVICVESYFQWGAKRFSGWEVERRYFETLGGKLIEAKPIQLVQKAPLLWQLRLQDSQGIRVIEVGRVISAGPFRDSSSIREWPPGSLLFELEQTASNTKAEDFEGWATEEERGKWLAGKIVRTLVSDLGSKRDEIDPIFKRAKLKLKRYLKHREEPYTPTYQGKWLKISESKNIKNFSGTPKTLHHQKPMASIECFEEISCNLCQLACPTKAIQIGQIPRHNQPILNESACTSCGKCLSTCPSNSIVMIQEKEMNTTSLLTLSWRGQKEWKIGEFATLVNRKGESLGSARITNIQPDPDREYGQFIQLHIPSHLIWEARGIKRSRSTVNSDPQFWLANQYISEAGSKVEITLNGEKRLVRDKVPISIALFEIGQARPQDILYCKDGSCGLCQVSVDSINKLGCQTRIHKGMNIKTTSAQTHSTDTINQEKVNLGDNSFLCSCLNITCHQVRERVKQGKLQSPEALLSITPVGEGKCHGQLCLETFKRILQDEGMDITQWIDWRFPWSDWTLSHN